LGRWTQQDPVHDPFDPKQWNRYVYVGGDPVNAQFPSARYLASAFENASSSRPDVVLNRQVTFMGGFMTRFSEHDLPAQLDSSVGHLGWHGVSFAYWDPLGERGIALVHSEIEPLAEPGRERLRRLFEIVLNVG
jgi:hypothetical protein